MAMLVAGIVLDVQKKFGWAVGMAALTKRIAAGVRRRLDALSVVGRHAIRRARWLLVG